MNAPDPEEIYRLACSASWEDRRQAAKEIGLATPKLRHLQEALLRDDDSGVVSQAADSLAATASTELIGLVCCAYVEADSNAGVLSDAVLYSDSGLDVLRQLLQTSAPPCAVEGALQILVLAGEPFSNSSWPDDLESVARKLLSEKSRLAPFDGIDSIFSIFPERVEDEVAIHIGGEFRSTIDLSHLLNSLSPSQRLIVVDAIRASWGTFLRSESRLSAIWYSEYRLDTGDHAPRITLN